MPNTKHRADAHKKAMDKVKIKRTKKVHKQITTKEKILGGLGVGSALIGGVGAVSAKPNTTQIVSTNSQNKNSGLGSKIKNAVTSMFGMQTAKAAFDENGNEIPDDNQNNVIHDTATQDDTGDLGTPTTGSGDYTTNDSGDNAGDTGDGSGNTGDTITTGDNGDGGSGTGDAGTTGDAGNTGNTGDTGNNGNAGDTGNTGNTGDTGTTTTTTTIGDNGDNNGGNGQQGTGGAGTTGDTTTTGDGASTTTSYQLWYTAPGVVGAYVNGDLGFVSYNAATNSFTDQNGNSVDPASLPSDFVSQSQSPSTGGGLVMNQSVNNGLGGDGGPSNLSSGGSDNTTTSNTTTATPTNPAPPAGSVTVTASTPNAPAGTAPVAYSYKPITATVGGKTVVTGFDVTINGQTTTMSLNQLSNNLQAAMDPNNPNYNPTMATALSNLYYNQVYGAAGAILPNASGDPNSTSNPSTYISNYNPGTPNYDPTKPTSATNVPPSGVVGSTYAANNPINGSVITNMAYQLMATNPQLTLPQALDLVRPQYLASLNAGQYAGAQIVTTSSGQTATINQVGGMMEVTIAGKTQIFTPNPASNVPAAQQQTNFLNGLGINIPAAATSATSNTPATSSGSGTATQASGITYQLWNTPKGIGGYVNEDMGFVSKLPGGGYYSDVLGRELTSEEAAALPADFVAQVTNPSSTQIQNPTQATVNLNAGGTSNTNYTVTQNISPGGQVTGITVTAGGQSQTFTSQAQMQSWLQQQMQANNNSPLVTAVNSAIYQYSNLTSTPAVQLQTANSAAYEVYRDSQGNSAAYIGELGGEVYYDASSRQLFLVQGTGANRTVTNITNSPNYNPLTLQAVTNILSAAQSNSSSKIITSSTNLLAQISTTSSQQTPGAGGNAWSTEGATQAYNSALHPYTLNTISSPSGNLYSVTVYLGNNQTASSPFMTLSQINQFLTQGWQSIDNFQALSANDQAFFAAFIQSRLQVPQIGLGNPTLPAPNTATAQHITYVNSNGETINIVQPVDPNGLSFRIEAEWLQQFFPGSTIQASGFYGGTTSDWNTVSGSGDNRQVYNLVLPNGQKINVGLTIQNAYMSNGQVYFLGLEPAAAKAFTPSGNAQLAPGTPLTLPTSGTPSGSAGGQANPGGGGTPGGGTTQGQTTTPTISLASYSVSSKQLQIIGTNFNTAQAGNKVTITGPKNITKNAVLSGSSTFMLVDLSSDNLTAGRYTVTVQSGNQTSQTFTFNVS